MLKQHLSLIVRRIGDLPPHAAEGACQAVCGGRRLGRGLPRGHPVCNRRAVAPRTAVPAAAFTVAAAAATSTGRTRLVRHAARLFECCCDAHWPLSMYSPLLLSRLADAPTQPH